MCGKAAESLAQVLSGCSALAQNRCHLRHNAALSGTVLPAALRLGTGRLSTSVVFACASLYKSSQVKAYWDVPVFAEHEHLPQNRVDARFIDHKEKVIVLEMSCPWMDNWAQKGEEKSRKYGPPRWKLKQPYPGYLVKQHSIRIDVLGVWSREVDLFGDRGGEILRRMQKLSSRTHRV